MGSLPVPNNVAICLREGRGRGEERREEKREKRKEEEMGSNIVGSCAGLGKAL